MPKANKDLFDAWCQLSDVIQGLASYVQNDMPPISMEELRDFKRHVKVNREFLNALEKDTIVHLIGEADAS